MSKTIGEINEKVKQGKAVVCTAEEIIGRAAERGVKKTAEEVDVVTTGTFGPMCSSGAYFNIGHTKPRIKLGGGEVYINDVPAYAGFAAVDLFLGATALTKQDTRNEKHPGDFPYGGGHVIEDLVAGKFVKLIAHAYGTDCYPRKSLETYLSLRDMNEAVLFNIRNVYQNYNVAVNLSDKTIYTYMGILKPKLGNANYCSAGQLSPLLNDPLYRTIGFGTKIFLGGGVGYVVGQGTQHNPEVKRTEGGVPKVPAGTLAVTGDLKMMTEAWLRGTTFPGYGVTLTVGIGVPIPILDEDVLQNTLVQDKDIFAQVVDYSEAYPNFVPGSLCEVSYEQLRSGKILVQGKEVRTAGISNYNKAKQICEILKSWIESGEFFLTEQVQNIPSVGSGYIFKPLTERLVI